MRISFSDTTPMVAGPLAACCTVSLVMLALVIAGPVPAQAQPDSAVLERRRPTTRYVEGQHFSVPVRPRPVGTATSDVVPVDVSSDNSGCNPADFGGFPRGRIALVRRGSCFFADKVTNAQRAGASGVLIFNSVDGLASTSLHDADVTVPVLFLTRQLGESFANSTERLTVHMAVRRTTR